jgi:hypothetical protein
LEPPHLPHLAGQGFRLSLQATLWLLVAAAADVQKIQPVVMVVVEAVRVDIGRVHNL